MTTNNGAGGLDSLEKIVAEMREHVSVEGCACCRTKEWADRIAALQAPGGAVPCKTVIVYGDHGPEEREPVEDYYTAPPSDVLRRVDGVGLIAAERKRQVEVEGWTPEHDTEHSDGALADAASCYASDPLSSLRERTPPLLWPWDESWWKPGDRIRELVKAGALIAAEIDRLQAAHKALAEGVGS